LPAAAGGADRPVLAAVTGGAAAAQQAAVADGKSRATHGPDFGSVNLFGTPHRFAGAQCSIVFELWKAWENGTPDVGSQYLLEAADLKAKSRISLVFRGNSAWGTMMFETPGKRGMYRLQVPTQFQ